MLFDRGLSKGIALMKERRYLEARDQFEALSRDRPKDPEPLFNLARAHWHLNVPAAAKRTLLECLKLDPKEELRRGILELSNWKRIVPPNYFNYVPNWSKDGLWLAYGSAREDTDGDGAVTGSDRAGLFIYDTARQTEWPILSQEFHSSSAAFSPDGRRLLYLSSRRDTNNDGVINSKDQGALYLTDLDSGQEKMLISDEHRIKYPSFSPDGGSVIFCGWKKGGAASGIYRMDLSTGQEKILVSEFYESTFPSFDPSGDRLLYSSWREDTNHDGVIDIKDNSSIYLLDLARGGERLLASNKWSNSYPVWSPDGKTIAYLSRRRDTNGDGRIDNLDNSNIMLLDAEKGTEEVLVSDSHHNKFPCWTADGSCVLFIGSWRRTLLSGEEARDYFENKGVYAADVRGKKLKQIVSDKYYGTRFLAASPKGTRLAYLSWAKGTGRGIYLADSVHCPDSGELEKIVQENL